MATKQLNIEETVRTTQASLHYLQPGPDINRRFVAAGVEVNTGRYGPYPTTIRDGRAIKDHFSFDQHGFQLLDAPTTIADFHSKDEVEAKYQDEVRDHVQRAFGASFVSCADGLDDPHIGEYPPTEEDGRTLSPLRRHPGRPRAKCTSTQSRVASSRPPSVRTKARGPTGPASSASSSQASGVPSRRPRRACPLAVCDARSVRDDEGTPNVLWVVDKIPEGDAMFAAMDNEDKQLAAAIFRHSPDHRWVVLLGHGA